MPTQRKLFLFASALTILASLLPWFIGGGIAGLRYYGFRIFSVVPPRFHDEGGGLIILLTLVGLWLVLVQSGRTKIHGTILAVCIAIAVLVIFHTSRFVVQLLQWEYAEPPGLDFGLALLVMGSAAMLITAITNFRVAQQ